MLTYAPFMTNSYCSAGCSHCPYGRNTPRPSDALERLTLFLPTLQPNHVVLLTGGEPAEDSAISEVVQRLENERRWYRIATGGHVDLSKFASRRLQFLTGVSLGTDCFIPDRNVVPSAVDQWRENVRHLRREDIAVSLTITIVPGDDLSFSWIEQIPCEDPSFVMLMFPQSMEHSEFGERLRLQVERFYPREILILNPIPNQKLRA